MPRYLLPCPSCNASLEIEPRQAGQAVRCGCGADVVAPGLRQLRELPQAEAVHDTTEATWGFREGVLTAGVLTTLALAAIGAYFWSNEPEPPVPFDALARSEVVDRQVQDWTPLVAWELWRRQYEPLMRRGRLDPFVNKNELVIEQRITMFRIYRWTFLSLAALVGSGSLLAYLTMSSAPHPGSTP